MTLASIIELKKLTGKGTYDDTILTEIIAQAEREIIGRLKISGVSLPVSDDGLKGAELNLAQIGVLNRMRADGSLPAHQEGASKASSDSIDKAIEDLRNEATIAINAYLGLTGGTVTSTSTRTSYNYNMLHYSGVHLIKKANQ